MAPFFSVIVPVYQAEKTLDRCVRSVLEQSFQDFELILIDDGSTDSSGTLCDKYADTDSRISVIHQTNHGVSYSRNEGIAAANGRYLAFLDSDDYLLDSHLETYHDAISDCDIAIGGFRKYNKDKESEIFVPQQIGSVHSAVWEYICRNPYIYGFVFNKVFRRELLQKHAVRFREDMYSQEDLDFCLSAFAAANRIRQISCESYQYYYAPGKRTPPTWDFIANQLKLLRLARERTQLSPETESCVQKRILSLLYTSLYTAAEQGTFAEMLQRMEAVAGLKAFLAEISAKGEHGFVAKAFASGKYSRIEGYFTIRHRLRDLYRILRRKH